jgi:hypothetical protein
VGELIQRRKAIGEIVASMILLLIASVLGSYIYSNSLRTSSEQTYFVREELLTEENVAKERFVVVNALVNKIEKEGELDPERVNISIIVLNYGQIDVDIDAIYVNDTPHFFRGDHYNIENFLVDVIEEKTWFSEEYRTNTVIHTEGIKKFYDFHQNLDKEIEFNIGARAEIRLHIVVVSKRGVSNVSEHKVKFES